MMRQVSDGGGRISRGGIPVAQSSVVPYAPRPDPSTGGAAEEVPSGWVAGHLADRLVLEPWEG